MVKVATRKYRFVKDFPFSNLEDLHELYACSAMHQAKNQVLG